MTRGPSPDRSRGEAPTPRDAETLVTRSLVGRTLSFDAGDKIALDSGPASPREPGLGTTPTRPAELDALARYEILAELGRGGMGIAQILEVFAAAGRGLEAVHARGLVHRDFKPDNVMIGVDGRPRVMDFGLARADAHATEQASTVRDTDRASPHVSASLTRSGAILGTPVYMAPEQLRGERADAAGDQFGFCVALYEAVYGERPFAGRDLDELATAIEQRELRRSPLVSHDEPPGWLRALLLRGLAPEPEQRLLALLAGDYGWSQCGVTTTVTLPLEP